MNPRSVTIDLDQGSVSVIARDGSVVQHKLESAEGFAAVSRAWVRASWDAKYVYSFTWHGRPVVQLPEDLLRIQEVIFTVQPDVIIETGIAHGGGLVYYATLCHTFGRGRVVGIDVEIREHNRRALEEHPLRRYYTLIEGDSIAPGTVEMVKSMVRPGERTMVMLDSKHTKDHVLAELELYSPLVTIGSYIVAMDGIMEEVAGAPRTNADWTWNNPRQAALEFVARHPEFRLEEPPFLFNEGLVDARVTYWPSAFLRRVA